VHAVLDLQGVAHRLVLLVDDHADDVGVGQRAKRSLAFSLVNRKSV
jgi:hypothetical protein